MAHKKPDTRAKNKQPVRDSIGPADQQAEAAGEPKEREQLTSAERFRQFEKDRKAAPRKK